MALAQTRLPKPKYAKLAKLAARNERSIAAELRVAIDRHLETADNDNHSRRVA